MDEALGAEPREEALGHPLLQVQVDGVVAEHAGVLEDHRTDGRLAPPVGQLLVATTGRPQGVEGRRPGRVGPGAPVEGRECPRRRPAAAAVAPAVRCQRLGAQQLQRARQGVAERLGLELHPGARAIEQAAAPLDLLRQVVAPVARRLQLLVGDLPADLVQIGRLYRVLQPVGVPVADAAAQPALDVVDGAAWCASSTMSRLPGRRGPSHARIGSA